MCMCMCMHVCVCVLHLTTSFYYLPTLCILSRLLSRTAFIFTTDTQCLISDNNKWTSLLLVSRVTYLLSISAFLHWKTIFICSPFVWFPYCMSCNPICSFFCYHTYLFTIHNLKKKRSCTWVPIKLCVLSTWKKTQVLNPGSGSIMNPGSKRFPQDKLITLPHSSQPQRATRSVSLPKAGYWDLLLRSIILPSVLPERSSLSPFSWP